MKNGFSLIELLVVISIIGIFTAITLANYRGGEAQFALERSAHKLAQDLRRAQEMTMSTRETNIGGVFVIPKGYGIYFDRSQPSQYILFANLNENRSYDGGNERLEILTPERGVRISNLSSGNTLNILFAPPDPTTWINGVPSGPGAVITLSLESNPAKIKRIVVNNAGLIAVTD